MTEKIKILMENHPEDWCNKITNFFNELSKPVILVKDKSEADLVIKLSGEKMECEAKTLYINGRISCPTAFASADLFKISRGDFGKLANLLNIKIFGCQLGCFK